MFEQFARGIAWLFGPLGRCRFSWCKCSLSLWALVFYQLWLRCCSGSPVSSVVCTGLRLFIQDPRVRGPSVVEVLVMFELWPGPGEEWLNMLYLETVGWSVSFEMFFLL